MEVDQIQNVYFSSYEELEVHRLMLEDRARTESYRNAILSNKNYFKDKVVMDVGCGTGILSIFCAQAGAKKVYAVEASSLANLAKDIVKENNFENIVQVIHRRVEDLVLPGIKVDVIVSEWMGFYLLHEGMLDSVFAARDRFLKENGRLFPETAMVYVAPCSIPSLYKSWDDMYGVSMSTFATALRTNTANKPEIMNIQPEDLLGPEEALCWIDLRYAHTEDVDQFELDCVIAAKKKGVYQGLCLWFECRFPNVSGLEDQPELALSTGPKDPPTHWKQTVIVLPMEQEVDVDEPIAFKLDMIRDSSNFRRYKISLTMLDPQEVKHPIGCKCYMTKCILINAYMSEHPEQGDGGNNMAVERIKSDVNTQNCLEEDTIDDDKDE